MKKLALLLAAMGIVSAAAFAEEPALKVLSIGQEIEIENQGGKEDFDEVNLYNNVTLGYKDWTIGLQAGKQWGIDFGDYANGVHSKNHRLQFDVWKKMNEDLKLGFRYRGQKNYDRYYARWDYNGSQNMFWSNGDVWYESNNDSVGREDKDADWIKAETLPIGIKIGPVKVGYYFQYYVALGDRTYGEQEWNMEHQIRLYAPLYKGERFSLDFEGRFTLATDDEYNDQKGGASTPYRDYDDFGRTRLVLKPSYKVSEALTVYGYYGYEWRDHKYENGDSRDNWTSSKPGKQSAENYQDIGLGWTYKF